MEPNRIDRTLPGRLDAEIFHAFGEDDSIVDRLLALPVSPLTDGADPLDRGIARRLETILAKRMRDRIENERRA